MRYVPDLFESVQASRRAYLRVLRRFVGSVYTFVLGIEFVVKRSGKNNATRLEDVRVTDY